MKKISILATLMLCATMVLTGCGDKVDLNSTFVSEKEAVDVPIDNPIIDVENEPYEILPMKMGIDIQNIEDASFHCTFSMSDINFEEKTIKMSIYEMDIYDAVEIENMKVGDSVVVHDNSYKIESIERDGDYVDINGGFGYEVNGMTFSAFEGGTYRTLCADDFPSYSLVGTVTLPISDEFIFSDSATGDFDDEPKYISFDNMKDYMEGVEEWFRDFSYINTKVYIKDNQIISISRHWVP